MSEKTLLLINGGPHSRGTTAAMLDGAAKAALEAGHRVERVNLYEENLAYCKGCRSCLETGRCVISDGMERITEQIRRCDAVVLAAPVYWANVPAAVKNLFDRLLGAAMEETGAFPKPRLPGKGYILLTACNTVFPFSWLCGQSGGARRAAAEFFKTAGMKCAGRFVCAGTGKNKAPSRRLLKRIARAVKSL